MSTLHIGENNNRSEKKQRGTLVLPPLSNQNSSKQVAIRPDSPRTRDACMELGIDPEEFNLKKIDDFGEDGCSQEVKQLRYQHYIDRIHEFTQEVQEKRLQYIQQARHKQVDQQSNNAPGGTLNMTKSLSESSVNPKQMSRLYNKTLGYIKSSHNKPDIQHGEEVIGFDESASSVLEQQMIQEIDKYNKLKEQKQKEAKIIYEENLEILETVDRMKEKELRLAQQYLKMKREKELKKEEMKQLAMEKSQKVKEIEQKYQRKKKEERDKIKKKLDLIKERQLKENEEREEEKLEQEEKEREKLEKMEQIRLTQREELVKHSDSQQEIIKQQLAQAQELSKQHYLSKVNKIKQKLEIEKEKVVILKEQRESNETQQLQKFVQKLAERNQHQRILEEKEAKEEIEKRQEEKEKELITQGILQKVKSQQNAKIEQLKHKFEKIEKTLERKRQEEEQKIIMKQELRKLKEQDMQKNYERQKRKDQFKLEKMLDKEKQHQEKLQLMKQQKELIKKTKMEISLQTKQETERIFECVKMVNSTLFPNISQSSKSAISMLPPESKEKGIKMLKSIFRQDQLDMSIFQPPQKVDATKKQA